VAGLGDHNTLRRWQTVTVGNRNEPKDTYGRE
jgi:hypothetical protein